MEKETEKGKEAISQRTFWKQEKMREKKPSGKAKIKTT
jgi:hypothetical protein